MVKFNFGLLVVTLSFALSGCLIRKGELPRIEELKPDHTSAPIPMTLDFKQTVDLDGTYVIFSEKLAQPMREDMTEALAAIGAVDVTDSAADFKLSVTFSEVRGDNFLWSMISTSTLFVIPYHASYAYKLEAELKWQGRLIRSYNIIDSADVWAHILLAPVGLFHWPRSVQNIQSNMLRTLASQLTSDIRNQSVSSL